MRCKCDRREGVPDLQPYCVDGVLVDVIVDVNVTMSCRSRIGIASGLGTAAKSGTVVAWFDLYDCAR